MNRLKNKMDAEQEQHRPAATKTAAIIVAGRYLPIKKEKLSSYKISKLVNLKISSQILVRK
jgi:hypothetical protein